MTGIDMKGDRYRHDRHRLLSVTGVVLALVSLESKVEL